ncbi:MAG TPA: amino acid adenylation domain-containing protein [Streptosporangiaceae bacterium]|nr:amino acid adenylation domain-containing protein [Streptosporangiaceae bacterium]
MNGSEGGQNGRFRVTSLAQRRLWFVDQLSPGSPDYLLPMAVRIKGDLDEAALTRAFGDILARHEVLRTRYAVIDGEPVQCIAERPELPVSRRQVMPGEDTDTLIDSELRRPFDLESDLPIRLMIARLAACEHLMLVVVHHIAFDGLSWNVFTRELVAGYGAHTGGGATPPPAPALQYADFAEWQHERLAGPRLARHLDYWRDRLAGLAPLELPTDRPRPERWQGSGDVIRFDLPAGLTQAVDQFARERRATRFMVLLAVFQAVLARFSGQTDVAVGTPVAGRTKPGTENLIGLFINNVVIRCDLSGAPAFTELLTRVRDSTLAAFTHADAPFERVVEAARPARDLSRNPLYQAAFSLRTTPSEPVTLPGLDAELMRPGLAASPFDLAFDINTWPDGSMTARLQYPAALFGRPAVARLAEAYQALLRSVLADPGRPVHEQCPGYAGAPPRERGPRSGRTGAGQAVAPLPGACLPGACLPDLVAAQAARTPLATAVEYGAGKLTYAGLLDRADRLALRLRGAGVGPETPVAVALHRDIDLVTALLAVLRAGGVYVPVDPDQPLARRAYVLNDSGATVLVSQAWMRDQMPDRGIRLLLLDDEAADDAGADDQGSLPALDPANAAYIVYTSGSTGRPKGVAVSHEAIRNRVLWTVREHAMGPSDRVLQKTTVSFDAALWEFLAPLVCGGTVVVAADGVSRDPAAIVRTVAAHRVTVLQLVPSVLRMLVAEPGLSACATLRLVFCAGEPLPVRLCRQLRGQLAVELVNTYGPTECAIDVTAWPYSGDEPRDIVAIGRPIDNTQVLVLDPALRPVPPGEDGELCVAGVQVARGYVGRGDLTAERFVPHPEPRVPGLRIYRTGDRVRRRADGVLEFLGRFDLQVKLRGMRIEPGEIEGVLGEYPGVFAAAVCVCEAGDGDQRLVAHVVAAPGAALDLERLRAHLAEQLPAAMVPSLLRALPALPLTPSGKIDRGALPGLADLDTATLAGDDGYVPPSGPAQLGVAAAFAEVLGVSGVGAQDDFFVLGGHSLLATLLIFRLRAAFGTVVPVAEIFGRRTVARIAELLAVPGTITSDDIGPVRPVARDQALPPSSAQQRLWFLDRLEPGSVEYLVPLVLRLTGPLNVPALTSALDALLARHEILRTRYVGRDGTPVQVIDPPSALGVVPVDLTGMSRPRAAECAGGLLRAEMSRPFALDAEWPVRARLIRVAGAEHLLVLTFHHIAIDAWSTDVLTRDLRELYRAHATGSAAPPPLPVQYADFACWQEQWSRGPRLTASLDYWRDRLAGLSPTELVPDRPRPAVRDPRGELAAFSLPAELARAVTDLAARHAVTPFVVLFAAFGAVLARYTGQTDITVGTPVAGRTRPEVENVAGLFTNTVVLRVDLSGDPDFAALLGRASECVVFAYDHQDLPFERLVDELRPERDLARNPLFQIMFDFRQAPSPVPQFDGLTSERVPAPWHTAKFDLTLSLTRRADGSIRGLLEYATALYDQATIDRLAGHYLHFLRQAADRPHAPLSLLQILTGAERRLLLQTWNPPYSCPEPGACVPVLFERQAAAHPDAEAVSFGGYSLTYSELNARANRLACHLRGLGARPGKAVAVCAERDPEVVTALLAVLKTGAMYVPMDPGHPAPRLSFMLADADAAVAVTFGRFAERLAGAGIPMVLLDGDTAHIASLPAGNPPTAAAADDLAYMIYTSGSTGQPKGVLIEHRAYAHHCAVIASEYGLRPGERVVLLSALTFDVAMDQIAATLLAGATVVVADPQFWNPAELPDRVAASGITIMEITPAYYREVMRHVLPGDRRLRGLRLMNVGSDVVTVADARRWAGTGLPGRFLANYGPTEATVTCMLHRLPDGPEPDARDEAGLPIGRPVPGTRAYVLDRHGDLVPAGVPGELHLAGVRLARGYHHRPALTAEKFVPDPFGTQPGGRLYRTGDLVRHRADGAIVFLGRIDGQIKLRGLRIELGEIEAVLAGHPGLRAVAAAVRELRSGEPGIVAYLVPSGDKVPDPAALRAYAAGRLPDYMCPALWITLPELPLTPSKKVDRKALPAPSTGRAELENTYVGPRTPAEEIIAEAWADVLGLDQIGVEDDVFLLGAHSLLATRMLARIDAIFGIDLPLRTLFEQTSVAALAAAVQAAVEREVEQMTDDEVAALLATAGQSRPAESGPSLEDAR